MVCILRCLARKGEAVVLAVPELNYVGTRFAEDNQGPMQRFTREAFDDARLTVAKKALEGRILQDGPSWKTPDELRAFAEKEGNQLVLAPPRPILVEAPGEELVELYQRLVHVEPKHQRRDYRPNLRNIFEPSLMGVPLRKNIAVDIPELGKQMRVPYAYKNGSLNLVRAEGFPQDPTNKINDLAVRGHLISKHKDADGTPMKLIVIGGFDPSVQESEKQRAEVVLWNHDTRLVQEQDVPEFVEEVRREAHE